MPRIAFAGTPEFAVPSLRLLLAGGCEVPLVLTQPDRPAGRGRRLTQSPVKREALEHGLSVRQPRRLDSGGIPAEWGDAPDLLAVAAYGLLIPPWLLEWPRFGAVNVHASLLPRWRGAAPMERAILAGDGSLLADLGQYPGDEWWAIRAADGSIQGGRPHPFGRTTVGTVWGDLAVIGVQDSYELRAFTADGTLARIVRRTGELARPARADLVDHHARLYAPWPEEERTQLLKDLDDMPLVDAYPAFGEVLADRAGHLWVREHSPSGDGDAPWTVYDPEGRIQGLAETPPGLDVFEIGVDYILGRARDDLGVEYVQLWTLVRDAGGAIGSTEASR